MSVALKLILLTALLVGVAATGVDILSGRRRGWRAGEVAWIEESVRTKQNDRVGARRLFELVGHREIEWLRRETFTSPWRDDRVVPLRALTAFDVNEDGLVDPHLEDAVARLVSAARSFLRVYDSDTITDPIVPDGTWRMIGGSDDAKDPPAPNEEERLASRNRLREAATEICASHADLSLLATNAVSTDLTSQHGEQ